MEWKRYSTWVYWLLRACLLMSYTTRFWVASNDYTHVHFSTSTTSNTSKKVPCFTWTFLDRLKPNQTNKHVFQKGSPTCANIFILYKMNINMLNHWKKEDTSRHLLVVGKKTFEVCMFIIKLKQILATWIIHSSWGWW
jgi:hypothetical protein